MLASCLLLAACASEDGDAGDEEAADDATDEAAEETATEAADDEAADDEAAADGATEAAANRSGETITIGWIPWEEDIAVTNLWHAILEENGYTVEQQQLDAGLLFDGLATGDLDLFLDAWLPNTHADYWEEYSDQVADLGVWLPEAPLTWAVPSYLEDINSIEDLADNAEMFDGQIVGIESSAGLTRISRDEVIPAYDLGDSYELVESSTPAMLAELDNAIGNEEPIVVTLWRPHPAYAEYDIKDLEDPQGALGEPDEIHAVARQGFADDFPEVAAAMEAFEFDNDTLSELEVQVLEEEGQELEAARAWLEENSDYVNQWLEGTALEL
ncbi:glycine betaine ABC transporter substrate-binding protein [Euzebya sp.]|uniref:glycine betaine ABC transporter substrate-binding protein n=1 Tax=Euzebya sp. TaxID=1971409 RepID=UPI003515F267